MRKFLLCAAAVLGVAVTIFGGYYYFTNTKKVAVRHSRTLAEMEADGNAPTDRDVPFKRRGGAWFSEDGTIRENGVADALSQRANYLAGHMPPDGFGDKGDARGIPGVPTNWVPRGPQNYGGRTEAVVLHPRNATRPFNRGILWAGGATGGVWKSYNSGQTWLSTNTDLQNFHVSCIAVDPENEDTLYAGTGQSDPSNLKGGGIFMSTDGGMNWVRHGDEHTYDEQWSAVNSISVAHHNGETIILAAVENYRTGRATGIEQGIMRYTSGNDTWTKVKDADSASFVGFDPNNSEIAVAATCYGPNPIIDPDGYCKAWYSADRGVNWLPSRLPRLPEQDPNCPPPSNGEFETCRYGDIKDTIHFAFQKVAPGSTSPVYAQYRNALANFPDQRTLMSKSTDGGMNYSTSNMTGIPEGIGPGTHAFWVSPQYDAQDPNSVSVISGGANLFRSNNNAASFEPQYIGNGSVLDNPINPHVDFQTIVTDPRHPNNKKRVYVATDGGIYHTSNITTATGLYVPTTPTPGIPSTTPSGWTALHTGLQNAQYFDVAGQRYGAGNEIIIGGTMDNGTLRQLGTSTDTVGLVGGDGGTSVVDVDNNGVYCFGLTTSGQLFRLDGCANVSPSPPPQPNEITNSCYVPDFPRTSELIIDSDPRNTNRNTDRAFLSAADVWRTADVKTPPRNPEYGSVPVWFRIKDFASGITTAMAVAPSDSNYMWVSHDGGARGDLWVTSNALTGSTPTPTSTNTHTPTATATPTASPSATPTYCGTIPVLSNTPSWTRVDIDENNNPLLPNREITKILIDQDSPVTNSTVYVGLGGFEGDNLWRTTDHGQSWSDVSGGVLNPDSCRPNRPLDGLPCAPVRAIARHPSNRNILFVGTEIGIYITHDVSAPSVAWEPLMNGPINVSTDDLDFIRGTYVLLAGTYGRGIWSLNFGPTPTNTPTATPTASPSPTGTPPEGILTTHAAINDFDGDGRSDLAVVREDSAHKMWHVQGSTEAYRSQQFGAADDQMAAADYDGDGKTDMAVFRGSESRWYCLLSSSNTIATTDLGDENAKSVPADFDGDSLADKAAWDPFTGVWEVQQTENGHLTFQWGAPGDKPVSIDIDGDAKADYGVLHEANGVITLSVRLENNEAWTKQFGLEGDVAVPGEYDGDGKIDLAVWRPDDDGEGNGCWYITYGADGYVEYDEIPWGLNGDVPVPGDYDGDGKLDIAVWRPATGMWHMLQSSNGYYSERFGADGDTPVGIKAVYASRPSGGSFTRVPPNAMPRRRAHQADEIQKTAAD